MHKTLSPSVSDPKENLKEDEILENKCQPDLVEEAEAEAYSSEEKTFFCKETEDQERLDVIESRLTSVVTEVKDGEILKHEENSVHETYENRYLEHLEKEEERIEVGDDVIETFQQSHVSETIQDTHREQLSVITKNEESSQSGDSEEDVDEEDEHANSIKDQPVTITESFEENSSVVKTELELALKQAEEHEIDEEEIHESCDMGEESSQQDEETENASDTDQIVRSEVNKNDETDSDPEFTQEREAIEEDIEQTILQNKFTELSENVAKENDLSFEEASYPNSSDEQIEVEEDVCEQVILERKREFVDHESSTKDTYASVGKDVLEDQETLECNESTSTSSPEVEASTKDDQSDPDVEVLDPIEVLSSSEEIHSTDDEDFVEVKANPTSHPPESMVSHSDEETLRNDPETEVKTQSKSLIEREAVHEVLEDDEILEEAVDFTDENLAPSLVEKSVVSPLSKMSEASESEGGCIKKHQKNSYFFQVFRVF